MATIFREQTLRVAWVRWLLRLGVNAVCAAIQLIPADILGCQDIRPSTSR